MKKKKKKALVIIVVCFIIILIIIRLTACGGGTSKAAPVNTAAPIRGDVEETISTSGSVVSEEVKAYYAKVSGVIGEVKAAAGDVVKKGDVLVSYDMEQMEKQLKEASLQLTSSSSSYQSTMAGNTDKQSKLAEANQNLKVLDTQIADYEAYIKDLQSKLDKNQRETSQSLSDESYSLNSRSSRLEQELKAMDPTAPEYAAKAAELQDVASAISRNNYLQQIASSSDYIVKMQKEIADAQEKLAEFKEYKAEMQSQKNASEGAVLDSYQKQQFNANNEIANMTYEQVQENYQIAGEGVTAEFDGIVMDCTAMEGATVTGGMQLLTLANSNNIKVSILASQYDIEKMKIGQKADVTISGNPYQGEISKINRMATTGNSGTPMVGVEIHITNPDSNIILGMEAKIIVYTNKAENVLLVPVEAINADKDGDFLFVAENGVVVRKPVVCGISSDTYIEIKEGITESDQIILSSLTGVEEGMAVTAMAVPAE